ncbi:MAG: RNA polymerase factor sigma-54 [candidate division NC10 bacterium]|nr:RNA polymerase factor sigma-54 [candidate division NC10 bacterium]
MSLEMKLGLRQTQKMIMTPMLQQAINLLQLTKLELVQILRKELEENPVLEEVQEEVQGGLEGETEGIGQEASASGGAEDGEDPVADFDWDAYLEGTSDYRPEPPKEDVERPDPERYLTKPRSLAEHLMFQLHLSTSDEELKKLGALIIGNLDENGYLIGGFDAMEELGEGQIPREAMEKALKLVQELDPIGVGARDLKECLLLQLDAIDGDMSLPCLILTEHLGELEGMRPKKLAEKLGVPIAEVQSALALITSLDPKPGRPFDTEAPHYIMPDVFIIKVDDRFVVVLDEEGLPRLRINSYYRALLSRRASCPRDVREYVEERMRSALWLIKSIHQRQRTLYKVTESIVKFQGGFLERGISALRPLTLREVADDIGMHESTVSRVTTNKYVQTPQGLFELKYFFHRGVPATDGESVSSLKVKDLVRKYLTAEGGKPLSDQKIAEILRKEHGIEIARRTVAKYRAQLKIPSSSQRRRV